MTAALKRMTLFFADFAGLRPPVENEVARFRRFLDGFGALRPPATFELRRIERFFHAFAPEETHRPLNVFRLFGLELDEVSHSGMLAWLLGPREEHACGRVFLTKLAGACGIAIPMTGMGDYVVRREVSYGESIVDVVVYLKGMFLVYVENKVVSPEGPAQLSRELRDLHRMGDDLRVPPAHRYAIFLTPSGRAPHTGRPAQWRVLSYAEVQRIAEEVMGEVKTDKARALIADWCETIDLVAAVGA